MTEQGKNPESVPQSRVPRDFSVFGFKSTHAALDAESLLLDMGLDVVPIPTPRSLGAHCGIALRLEPADAARALDLLSNAGIAVDAQGTVQDVAQNGR